MIVGATTLPNSGMARGLPTGAGVIGKKKAGTVHWAKVKAYARGRKIDDMEAIAWIEVAGTAVSRALQDYRRTGLIEHLTDAQHGAEQVAGLIEAMVERAQP